MTDPILMVVALAASITLVCCLTLTFHRDYDDGLLERSGMGLISLVAFARIWHLIEFPETALTTVAIMTWVGLSLIFGARTYRFLRRSSRRDGTWYSRGPQAPGNKSPLFSVQRPARPAKECRAQD